MNDGENNWNNNNGKLFEGKCNKYGNYCYRMSDCWGISNKNDNRKKIRLQEIPASTGNTTLVEKEATGLFIVWKIKENIKTMPSTTSL